MVTFVIVRYVASFNIPINHATASILIYSCVVFKNLGMSNTINFERTVLLWIWALNINPFLLSILRIIPVSSIISIDKEHFEAYPYCGVVVPGARRKRNAFVGRIVNSKSPEEKYRWAVPLERQDFPLGGSDCSGSVISDR